MPLIYGEKEGAFIRLQEEIMRNFDDQSLFAWRSRTNDGLLATSPADFVNSYKIIQWNPFNGPEAPFTVSSRRVHLDVRFMGIGRRGLGLAILHCKEIDSQQLIAIYVRDSSLRMYQLDRVWTEKLVNVDLTSLWPVSCPIRSICLRNRRTARTWKRQGLGQSHIIEPSDIYPSDWLENFMHNDDRGGLAKAAADGLNDLIWLFLTRSDFSVDLTEGNDKPTPLIKASARGNNSSVNLLLDRGANIEATDKQERTSMSWAAENGHDSTVRLLLDRGARIEKKGYVGRTPLVWAVSKAQESIFRLLLNRGADIETKDTYGQTPLIWVFKEVRESIIRLLLDRGVDIENKDTADRTPLLLAIKKEQESIIHKYSDGRSPRSNTSGTCS